MVLLICSRWIKEGRVIGGNRISLRIYLVCEIKILFLTFFTVAATNKVNMKTSANYLGMVSATTVVVET